MTEIYLVAGATGGLGQQIVSRLLLKNRHVRAFVRDAAKGRALLGENLEVVEGDTRRIDTVHGAMQGIHTVICTTAAHETEGQNSPEQVDYEGVRNLANVAAHVGVERFVLVSALAARANAPSGEPARWLEWMRKGEEALRDSGVDYLIVRPGKLTDAPAGENALRFVQGETVSGQISRVDLAEVLLQVLARDNLRNMTFEVIAADGRAPQTSEEWNRLLERLQPDT